MLHPGAGSSQRRWCFNWQLSNAMWKALKRKKVLSLSGKYAFIYNFCFSQIPIWLGKQKANSHSQIAEPFTLFVGCTFHFPLSTLDGPNSNLHIYLNILFDKYWKHKITLAHCVSDSTKVDIVMVCLHFTLDFTHRFNYFLTE